MLIVQKFGGTSVANLERIRAVGERVRKTKEEGHDVVVVLSAPAGETDQLLKLANEISESPDPRECDSLISLGEQKNIALLGLYLHSKQVPCISLTAAQIPILSNKDHGKARILHIVPDRIRKELKSGKIVILPGFQGITDEGDTTTLGRGGSDTSAVAFAAALKADLCEIYTDVDGVYTADPRVVENPKLLKKISYEEMMELADSGAKVLQTRSVEVAAKHRVPLKVRSSFNDKPGTEVVAENETLEKILVAGVTLNTQEAKVAIRRIPSEAGVLAKFFAPLAEAGINVDMIVENLSKDGTTDLAFTVSKEDLRKTLKLAEGVAKRLGAGKVEAASDIAKISIVGLGMRTHAGVAYQIFKILADLGVTVQMVSTSEIKVSLVVAIDDAKRAVKGLHQAFGLDRSE
ncbi:MAG: aspartate kinase [Deltaproteobacteria bacterium RIFCSPLOWO2_12_FULL_44_12]|nr:MAG: aspartate kinase [Deltaproteobacteria bacterium RIFCSPHIGHO2_01_FULL_43_49]OGQ14249.1 MAG: aspartate kinase [Deltaproteobacteria bacterium RIFCSPHIGHO2_02_FULL_44_53]OGQ27465.1 MAG: aspartate kinase [Deltaproteobacteria bacterium RIFCSPHIGHO2_12_FULL_44_21]OGQ30713.1 MAG: aspartate kinase [Deltaproteobacteria bacterium RIFCSPLOWO2_01_FULL_45_74]OGQ42390.1 MAG: aspartate kinase [Deltaproteobacteria bacterium RIFCSPLOWO2_02_FULL_44_34]OGQ69190.1 MAG: aspartate kinase [Deltaproteobacteria